MQNSMSTWLLVLSLSGLVLAQDPPKPSAPPEPPPILEAIDFAKLDRTAPKLPATQAHRSFGLYLFGLRGEHRVWAVLEAPSANTPPTQLWFDGNADGAFAAGERFASEAAAKGQAGGPSAKFVIGDYRAPGSDVVHKAFTITWTATTGVRFHMVWRGEKPTFGGFGPGKDTYANFADSPQLAPVFVPGYDRPFEFERWQADPLQRGAIADFKVFVGNRGDRTGAFAAVDDKFLPNGEIVYAALHYTDRNGNAATAHYQLPERC